MPAAYAHHRFGETCLESLPPKLKVVCMRYRELFDIGVHGPDVLFYFDPMHSNEVNRYGQELHTWTGEQFFEVSKYSYQANEENRKAMLAYLLGFLAHFTLDSSCHGYINEEAVRSALSHNLIESQYESFLMTKDGLDPLKVDRSLPLRPSREKAEIIARFFPIDEGKILKAMKGQKKVLHLLYSPNEKKKKALRKVIALCGVKGDFGDLFLDSKQLWECEMMNRIIFMRQGSAAELYPKLADNLVHFLYDREELNEYFSYDFEGEYLEK